MDKAIPSNGEIWVKSTKKELDRDWHSSTPTTLENDENHKQNRILNKATPETVVWNTMNDLWSGHPQFLTWTVLGGKFPKYMLSQLLCRPP